MAMTYFPFNDFCAYGVDRNDHMPVLSPGLVCLSPCVSAIARKQTDKYMKKKIQKTTTTKKIAGLIC